MRVRYISTFARSLPYTAFILSFSVRWAIGSRFWSWCHQHGIALNMSQTFFWHLQLRCMILLDIFNQGTIYICDLVLLHIQIGLVDPLLCFLFILMWLTTTLLNSNNFLEHILRRFDALFLLQCILAVVTRNLWNKNAAFITSMALRILWSLILLFDIKKRRSNSIRDFLFS